jgi:acetyl-CoA carboxylase biotin carboxyl carrier protein
MEDTLFIEIQRLCQLVHDRELQEIAISRPDFSIAMSALKRQQVAGTILPPVTPTTKTVAIPPVENVKTEPEGYTIASPLIGIFYRSSSPDAPSFVEIGDTVEEGQTIGIVEAMKVFNEITADRAGTVIAIPVENGSLVQIDQPLVILNPSA